MAVLAPQVWLFGDDPRRTQCLREELVRRGIRAERAGFDEPLGSVRPPALALLALQGAPPSEAAAQLQQQALTSLRDAGVPTLIWGVASGFPEAERVSPETSFEEIIGRLTTMTRYVPLVRQLDSELQHMQRMAAQLNRYFDELDKEMRLAGRLQREFMPREIPKLAGLYAQYIFRPATFVSGDIFDVIPLDERRVGLFIADAMGHGTAAGLMTMFLRKELTTVRGVGAERKLVSPSDALMGVHDGLARHQLSGSQFVTAAYAIIDTVDRTCWLARGGHPHPIHVPLGQPAREIRVEGGLMGLPEVAPEFCECHTQLGPGDKLIFYTDGLEDIFLEKCDADAEVASKQKRFSDRLLEWCALPAEQFVPTVESFLDHREGSLNPEDDISLLVAELA